MLHYFHGSLEIILIVTNLRLPLSPHAQPLLPSPPPLPVLFVGLHHLCTIIKLNFDRSCKPSVAAAEIIIRNNNGQVLSAIALNLESTQVAKAEYIVLHEGIQEAIRFNINHLAL